MVASKSVLNRGMFMLRIVHSHVEGGKSAHRQIYLLATLSTWCTSLMLSRPSRNEAFSPSACPGIHCLCKKQLNRKIYRMNWSSGTPNPWLFAMNPHLRH